MPIVQAAHPIAVLVSDLHLTLLQPKCRADDNWMETQEAYLRQVTELASSQGHWVLPILCAGDIFDRWNPPAELICFALQHLPNEMYCVPGQHDLPNHRLDGMHRSGYGVLKAARRIKDLSGGAFPDIPEPLSIYGFGWNEAIQPPKKDDARIKVAVIHRYCWTEGKAFPDAPQENNVTAFKQQLKGYDVAVFGDNHKGFTAMSGDCLVVNCGSFIRRKSDETEYQPRLGILYSDGSVKLRKLDISGDKFHEAEEDRKEIEFDMQGFIKGLEKLGNHGLDFREMVKEYLEKEKPEETTKEIILSALG